jgi:hypothetical protein
MNEEGNKLYVPFGIHVSASSPEIMLSNEFEPTTIQFSGQVENLKCNSIMKGIKFPVCFNIMESHCICGRVGLIQFMTYGQIVPCVPEFQRQFFPFRKIFILNTF